VKNICFEIFPVYVKTGDMFDLVVITGSDKGCKYNRSRVKVFIVYLGGFVTKQTKKTFEIEHVHEKCLLMSLTKWNITFH